LALLGHFHVGHARSEPAALGLQLLDELLSIDMVRQLVHRFSRNRMKPTAFLISRFSPNA
jgi:hypothetical protein